MSGRGACGASSGQSLLTWGSSEELHRATETQPDPPGAELVDRDWALAFADPHTGGRRVARRRWRWQSESRYRHEEEAQDARKDEIEDALGLAVIRDRRGNQVLEQQALISAVGTWPRTAS